MVFQCVGCEMYTLQPLGTFKASPSTANPDKMKTCLPNAPTVSSTCEHCGHKFHVCIDIELFCLSNLI